jgi:hypothetical protein
MACDGYTAFRQEGFNNSASDNSAKTWKTANRLKTDDTSVVLVGTKRVLIFILKLHGATNNDRPS